MANNDEYLDKLHAIYPIMPNIQRSLDYRTWSRVEKAFSSNDDRALIGALLDLKLFPIKHPFVAYMRRDRTSIQRNPQTVKRITSELRGHGLDALKGMCSAPKEQNRQIGPMFRQWVEKIALAGETAYSDIGSFVNGDGNRYLVGTDALKKECVETEFNHQLKKGPDVLAIWNRKYVLGEAKLITDLGGHQQTQFDDAMDLLKTGLDAVRVAILDGVIYISDGNSKMQKAVRESNHNIMSALLFREFLDSL